jgi:amidase
MLGTAEVFVPAGYSDSVYDPQWKLSDDGTKYEGIEGTSPTKPASPLPYNIAFWAGPGEESVLIKVASAYENATKHFKAPPAFGPLKGEP